VFSSLFHFHFNFFSPPNLQKKGENIPEEKIEASRCSVEEEIEEEEVRGN
jgi:hypothetical protein